MKNTLYTFIIPILYIVSLALFFGMIQYVIRYETKGQSELYEALYSFGFFMTHTGFAIVLAILLVLPFVLLAISLFNKRKEVQLGYFISCLVSLVLVTLSITS